jgi:hypothetical protein
MKIIFLSVEAGLAITLLTATARAGLLSYDSFSYQAEANGIHGENGGTGFSGPWNQTEPNSPDVLGSSLGYTDSNGVTMAVTGGSALADATNPSAGSIGETVTAFRDVSGAMSMVTGGTLYLSFLGQQTQGTEQFVNVALYSAALQEIAAIGHASSSVGNQNWGAYTGGGTGGVGGFSTTPTATLSLLVFRIDLNVDVDGHERFRLYVNPTLGTEPGSASVDIATANLFESFTAIDRIRIGAGGSNQNFPASQLQVDELRIADSYESVAPVPEPSTIALAAAGLALIPLRRGRNGQK